MHKFYLKNGATDCWTKKLNKNQCYLLGVKIHNCSNVLWSINFKVDQRMPQRKRKSRKSQKTISTNLEMEIKLVDLNNIILDNLKNV